MTGIPAARFGDTVSHTDAGFGFDCGGLLGLAAGALLVGATIATGGAALAVVAAVGGAVALTGGGALAGMNIGTTYGHVEGDITTGSPNVIINNQLAARTLADIAICHDHNGPQQIATGSTSVFFNRMPAARLGDQTVCDARISSASPNVIIGGGTAQYAAISAEVSPLAITVARDMAIGGAAVALGAGAGAAFLAAGWAGVGVFGLQAGAGIAGGVAGGYVGGAIGGAIDPVHGAAWGQAGGSLLGGLGGAGAMRGVAGAGGAAEDDLFQPKAIGQTEPGAVPPNADLQAQMDAAAGRGGMSAPGYPDLPPNAAQTFGADPVPWDGDDPANGGSMSRVIGSADSDNGSFWSPGDPPDTEADWRGGSAVKNDWNGNGATVQIADCRLEGVGWASRATAIERWDEHLAGRQSANLVATWFRIAFRPYAFPLALGEIGDRRRSIARPFRNSCRPP